MPENIARLLYVLRILLEFGRHLLATMERRAAGPGSWLFRAIFGTAELPVIYAHLRRGLLRAAALESLLLARAAAGHDVVPSSPDSRAAPGADPSADLPTGSLETQVAHLTAARARQDAPIDPDNQATAESIAAEVHARPISRTIAEISRDLGVVAVLCTRDFWDAITDAIARFEDSTAACPANPQPEPEQPPQSAHIITCTEQENRGPDQCPHWLTQSKSVSRPASPLRANPILIRRNPASRPRFATTAPATPRHNVTIQNRNPAMAVNATGPPLRLATKLAA